MKKTALILLAIALLLMVYLFIMLWLPAILSAKQAATPEPTQEPTATAMVTLSSTPVAPPEPSFSTTKTASSSFTNKYGTRTTICAYDGCSAYIAASGDTNCCITHSNKCLSCRIYIDGDAAFCMSCLEKALTGK